MEGENDDIDFEKSWHPFIEPIREDITWEIADLNDPDVDNKEFKTEIIDKYFNSQPG